MKNSYFDSAFDKEINKMDAETFRKEGYLQELNRLFLHPLGMALEIYQDADGKYSFGDVWDYRNDPEGMMFADLTIEDAFRAARIEAERKAKAKVRFGKFGWALQPCLKQDKGDV